ncbi:MAG: response regulator [Actinomycetota bacterium]
MNNVLLIDDEEEMGTLVQACLNQLGAKVHQVRSVSEALANAFEANVDLILLDFALRDEDGLELLPRLRESPVLQGLPIIGFSVHESKKAAGLDAGLEGFVAKPFKVSHLRAAVKPFLR